MKKWLASIAIALFVIIAGMVGLVIVSSQDDFHDSHALLTSFDIETGIVTIDAYGEVTTGKLNGIAADRLQNREKIRELVGLAQRDFILFDQNDAGEISIWYETENGSENLNQQILELTVN